jgi:hypothetical protein
VIRYFHQSDEDHLPSPFPSFILQDVNGVLWSVTINDTGTLKQRVTSGSPITLFLNDNSAGTTSWQIKVSIVGSLVPTPVTFNSSYPTALAMVSESGLNNYNLTVTSVGSLDPLPTMIEVEGDWWAGVQQCASRVALAASMVLAVASTTQARQVFSYHQDDPVLKGAAEEYYWQNPVQPIPASLLAPKPWIFDEQTPALSQPAVLPPDEDFYSPPLPWKSIAPIVFSDDEVAAPEPLDEDFWAAPPPWPTLAITKLFTDDDLALAQPVLFQPDEDFWKSGVAQVSGWWISKAFSDDDLPLTQPVTLQADEDFWFNPVLPIQAPSFCPQQWTFDVQEPAGNLSAQTDELFWAPQIPPQQWIRTPQAFSDDEVLEIAAVTFSPDEDYWQPRIQPPTGLWQIHAFSDEDLIFSPTEDEDYWQNPVLPVQAKNFIALPYLPDAEQVPTGFLRGQLDEDFWINPVAPLQATNLIVFPYIPDHEDPAFGVLPGPFVGWAGPLRVYPQMDAIGYSGTWNIGTFDPDVFDPNVFDTDPAGPFVYWNAYSAPVRTYPQLALARISAYAGLSFGNVRIISLD